jgi:carbon starvation protein
MAILLITLVSLAVLLAGGSIYSRFLARSIGEQPSRPAPSVALSDGRDYVPTPTSVVFAHHFAAIAGAGPILGPVLAVVYGWVPALIWVVCGGLFIGAVHDYLATYIATREGGQSIATVARRMLGNGPFVALTGFLVVMLALVCATFLNYSASALTSTLPAAALKMPEHQMLFRVDGGKVVIGGIASTSVIVITIFAPLIGWMYIKRGVSVWICSLIATAVCVVGVAAGVLWPVSIAREWWMAALAVYCMLAAGLPVWLFLQSRDFVNVHILYVGLAALLATLLVAGGSVAADPSIADGGMSLPQWSIDQGEAAMKAPLWPMLFITIACGAVSGFHSLCGGGTTCKQLKTERAARTVGYWAMLLETFLAVAVIAVLVLTLRPGDYLAWTHPAALGQSAAANPILTFAYAVGKAANMAFGSPIAWGAIGGMVLLEGFLVTTLDTAIRLMRYLIEEIWRAAFGRYDVFAQPVAAGEPQAWPSGENSPAGSDGIPAAPTLAEQPPAPPKPVATSGPLRALLRALRQYWVNSGLAMAITLLLAFSGAANALWAIFATANQLLAAFGLLIASLWLLRAGRRAWFAFLPALFMLALTLTSLVLLLGVYLHDPMKSLPLLVADVVMLASTAYLLPVGAVAAVRELRTRRARRRAPKALLDARIGQG